LSPQRAFSGTDLGVLIGAPFFTLPAWLLPERSWPALGRLLSPMAIGDLTQDPAATEAVIRKTLGARLPDLPAGSILRDMGAEGICTFFQVLKCYRPSGWKLGGWVPPVRISGFEHVRAALASGRGAVLWVSHAFHGHLGSKVGFHRAGLEVVHLSTPAHGFSATRFGVRYLNRIQTRIEDRFIAERVMLPLQGQNAALQTLAKRLKANKVVSITGQRGTGRTVEARFLDGMLPLAPGAPSLAYMTGAKLLPVFAFRAADGVVEVTAEPEIALEGSREDAVARAVQDFATRSEPYVLRYPGQWLSWVQL
jgi:lauroyl/myristoyl acyltransferase